MRSGKAAASSGPGSPAALVFRGISHAAAGLVGGLADAVQGAPIGVGVAVGDGGQAGGDVGWGFLASQRVAFLEQRGEVGGEGGLFFSGGGQHHGCQPGVAADAGHFPAGAGDPVLGVQGAEVFQ